MKYVTYLKNLKKCPFCGNVRKRILLENKKVFLTFSRAPYHKYHLLVVPKRHVENIRDLTKEENIGAMSLVVSGIKSLNKIGHNDCTVIVRDGKALAKSINHLHYHIIPGGDIEDVSLKLNERKILNEKEEKSLKKELKKIISQK